MKTCSRCGRSYPDAQLLCSACNQPLPKGEAADLQTAAHINYLLSELPQWVMAGWMDPAQARQIAVNYERRRDEILMGGLPKPTWDAAAAPPPPGLAFPRKLLCRPGPAGPARPWQRSVRTDRWRTGS